MRMTPMRFILLRVYNLTLGRIAIGAKLLRKVLVWLLISKKVSSEKYVASSRYFSYDDLEE